MNLEELKNRWKEVDVDLSGSSTLRRENLVLITQKKVKVNFYKIVIPELLKSILYLFGAFFLIIFFNVFSTLQHRVMASISILLFLVIPILSIFTFLQYYKSGNFNNGLYKSLNLLKRKGQNFIRIQYLLIVLNFVLLCNCVVLIPLVYTEELNTHTILVSISVCMLGLSFLSWRIWRFYKRRISRIEALAESIF